MLLAVISHGGLSDVAVEDMANSNLHVMRFLDSYLEDDVPDHSVLSCFKTRLTAEGVWDGLLGIINEQIQRHGIMVTQGLMWMRVSRIVNASLRASHRDDEVGAQAAMRGIEVMQLGGGTEARWVKKKGKSVSLVISNVPSSM